MSGADVRSWRFAGVPPAAGEKWRPTRQPATRTTCTRFRPGPGPGPGSTSRCSRSCSVVPVYRCTAVRRYIVRLMPCSEPEIVPGRTLHIPCGKMFYLFGHVVYKRTSDTDGWKWIRQWVNVPAVTGGSAWTWGKARCAKCSFSRGFALSVATADRWSFATSLNAVNGDWRLRK